MHARLIKSSLIYSQKKKKSVIYTGRAPELPQSNEAGRLGSHARTCSVCLHRSSISRVVCTVIRYMENLSNYKAYIHRLACFVRIHSLQMAPPTCHHACINTTYEQCCSVRKQSTCMYIYRCSACGKAEDMVLPQRLKRQRTTPP